MTHSDQIPFASPDLVANPEPRCPCLLLLDTSGSMSGRPIEELNQGLRVFKEELTSDDMAMQRVEVAVITFGQDEQHYCLVRDFSDGGVRLHVKGFDAPDDFSLRFAPGAPARSGDYKVAWRNGQDLGAKFVSAA